MKNNGKSRGMDKKKAEKILATVVMGMNLVNTVAPLAALAGAEQKLVAAPQPARSEAEPLDYAVLPQLADMVDRAIFARAEATEYDGNASVASMVSGDGQNITAGQSGTVSTMNGGTQNISIGGSGTVSTMNGAQQNIASGGVGTVSVMNSGLQYIFSGGKGTVSTMKIGLQNIFSGGSGTVSTIDNWFGSQNIFSGGKGTVGTINNGFQSISNGGVGTVSTINGGNQTISSGGSGTVSTMNGGAQQIGSGGVGSALGILGGQQQIASGGTGYVEHVTAKQIISGGGTGIVGTVTAGDSWNLTAGQTGIANSMNGGAQTVSAGGVGTVRALNSGTQAVLTGGTAANTTINGGTQNIASGGTALATEVSGGMMQLASGGIVSGLTMTGGSLELSAVSGGSFAINGTLSATNASIDMTDHSFGRNRAFIPPAYETLTIDKLSGSGNTFIMDTDLGSDNDSNSDKLIIKDADVGIHYVQIRDLSKLNGIQVTGEHKQLLITDNSGKLTFEGKGFNAGGLWDIDPTLAKGDTLGQSANNWYLTKVAKTANNDTRVLLEAANNSYALWRNTNDSLRSRLGALGNGSEHADGIWARTQAGRFSGDNYEGRYNLYQFGYDKADNAKSIYGLAVDYGDGTGSYSPGSGKDKLKSFSLYSVWTADNGSYTNVTARYGIVSTDLESYGDYPDKAEYKQHACSVSVEYGKRFDLERGLFIEPNAQFTLGRLGSIDYTTDRGANGRIEGMNSALGRIGFVMGQKIENGSDIYLKADLLHEFAGERDLVLTSDAGGTNDILTKHNDYGDTWFELGLGGNVRISKTGNFYGEVTRGFSGDINKKWSVNAGLRFTF
ncbi:outer membrane autotransporter protein [Phascolarctobacterium faecium DSM 14760]|uniref:autotransporter outer membrane beta-barrel domain-containing protein n=1 Tax=Phascolarctobacterium faecium TaxID=33025 RepID=UPI000DC42EBF|nr:autotransporter outer membrane beta-barrel domain-containing protein [Phascolarctobacterium faecium]RAS55159.1 outer membrane autotransporter protein [Phascolarctobacterium faecium DSM 14760]